MRSSLYDVTLSQGQSDMDRVTAGLAKQFPATNSGVRAQVISLREAETAEVRGYVNLVSASVLLLLAIGCINVASLFMARASEREREFAIRGALGSTAVDMIKQLVGESLLHGAIGGAFGIALAFLEIRGLIRLLPLELPSWMILRLDWRVLLFSAGVSIATALVFGLSPLIGNIRPTLNEALKCGGKGSSGGNVVVTRFRRGLIIVEVALSLLLLVGAGLMFRSFTKLMSVDTGVRIDHLIVATVNRYLPNASPAEQVKGYSLEYQKVYERLAALPGVTSASAGDEIPYLGQPENRHTVELFTKARPTPDLAYRTPAASADVMPGYFKALGIRLLAGRDFTESDGLDRPPVAIISQYTAETFYPGRSAIGEQIRWGSNDTYNPWSTVIGVVTNTKWNPAEREPDIEVYWSALQYPPWETSLLIRTMSSAETLLPAVRKIIHDFGPDLAVVQSKTMDVIVSDTVWQHRLWSCVLGIFATLALFLTAVGLYGVMSYLVSQSTREMGIRMAIGSTPNQVLRLVLKRGLLLVASGLAAGLACAFAAHRLLTALLYGISDTDPSTYAAVILLLSTVTLAACAFPALRAAHIDPLVALRED
jgi:putative ABC transport system permease protein